MSHSGAHHLGVGDDELRGNGGRGRVVLLPGSIGRARQIAERFDDLRVCANPRGLDVHLGRYGGVDVATLPTGMGCPSVGIVVTELIAIGARRLVRVGTAGTLQDGIAAGSVVIAHAAVRDESTSDAWCPRDVPAVAHPDWVTALRQAAVARGLGERAFVGTVHSKDAFYGREVARGPRAQENHAYMAMLSAMGVLATEMEASHLFVLAAVHDRDVAPVGRTSASASAVKAGTVLAVVGGLQGFAAQQVAREAEEHAIGVALDGAVALIRAEG